MTFDASDANRRRDFGKSPGMWSKLLIRKEKLYRPLVLQLVILALTLVAAEVILQIVDFRVLQGGTPEGVRSFQYDPELGWAPIPTSESVVIRARQFHIKHNSLGIRDIEYNPGGKPTILFIGDSYVWGYNVEAEERFTDLLRARLPDYAVVNAGVTGYGTDQEYLFLRRLSRTIKPSIVVLVFCTENDRTDNSSNLHYNGYYKPYFAPQADGSLRLAGQPVPSDKQYFNDNFLAHNFYVVRALIYIYTTIRHPAVSVPDATERLVDMVHDEAESQGARFLVGLQSTDAKLAAHLQNRHYPFTAFDGAEEYPTKFSAHWTPKGHLLVADNLMALFAEAGIAGSAGATASAPVR